MSSTVGVSGPQPSWQASVPAWRCNWGQRSRELPVVFCARRASHVGGVAQPVWQASVQAWRRSWGQLGAPGACVCLNSGILDSRFAEFTLTGDLSAAAAQRASGTVCAEEARQGKARVRVGVVDLATADVMLQALERQLTEPQLAVSMLSAKFAPGVILKDPGILLKDPGVL